MKEKLEEITQSQFVDLVCGNTKVLLADGETAKGEELAIAARNIILEYRAIADPGGANGYFKHIEGWIKAKLSVIVYTMCHNLASMKEHERAREVLMEFGLSASKWTEARIEGTIQSKLEKAKRELSDMETESEKVEMEREMIRSRFDEQAASLMAHFKFQIEPDEIKATLYAHLVARYNREMKARMAAMKRK